MFNVPTIKLRTPELEDVEVLYEWENNPSVWNVSQTRVPFSRKLLEQYILSAQDIFVHGQVRFVIVDVKNNKVGAIDLFDYDAINQRAGVGIVIDPSFRKKGYAEAAIKSVVKYAQNTLMCHQLHCLIGETNRASVQLFEKCGFQQSGRQRKWLRTADGWEDVLFYQLTFDR